MPVIAFEGLDGVGKTTAANAVGRRRHGLSIDQISMSPVWKQRRAAVNAGSDVEARFRYFVDLNKAQMQLAQRFSEDRITFGLDSSIYRTLATHRVLGSVAAQEYEIEQPLIPDTCILLDLPEDRRLARLKARDKSLVFASKWDIQLHESQAELRAIYQAFGLITLSADQPAKQLAEQAESLSRV